MRVVLAVAALAFVLGMVQKTPCVRDDWSGGQAALRRDVLLRRALPLHRARLRRPATCPTPTTAAATRRWSTRSSSATSRTAPRWVTQALSGSPRPARAGRRRRRPGLRRSRASRPESGLLLRGDRGAAGPVRPARRLVPRRRAPATALGRDAVRGVARAGAGRADQLGPARGRRGGRGAVGVVARPAGARRGADRPRHRHQALPAVPARRAARGLPAPAAGCARSPRPPGPRCSPGWW